MQRIRLQPATLMDPQRFSLGWRVGNMIFLAGALGAESDGTYSPDIRDQTRRALEKLAVVLREANGSLTDIVKMTVFITDMRLRERFTEARAEFFQHDAPASTLVQVVALAYPGALIEIEGIAVLD
jgi:2-iminobutanoate/2-iminopropanoate deaminase